jgi:RNA polymerase sigma factor (sigma-70 family)
MHDIDSQRQRFEELFRTFHPAVRAYARRRVPAGSVDDVVSETFLVAWRRADQVPQEPLPWLLAVARNTIGTERRGQARRLRLWLKAQSCFVEAHDPWPEDGGLQDRVRAALARLDERDREALMLIAWDGLTPAEAAESLGIPANRFRVRLHRARLRLSWALAAEPEADAVVLPSPTSVTVSSKGATL